ncbi:MAG TPA: hypothetical protein VKB35_12050, partial [Ktedonobacteraceae bacterium]|nr:hypothetical protein [Ktedonobacteraceae bacterium]
MWAQPVAILRSADGTRRTAGLKSSGLSMLICCILLFLSSCSSLSGGIGSAAPTPVLSKPSPSPTPARARTDSAAESPLKAQLAKVQQIMAGMTLDQKLGQLIIVEYLGNSYTGTGLQYMIANQYV